MIDIHKNKDNINSTTNIHFQQLIDKFQEHFDVNKSKCDERYLESKDHNKWQKSKTWSPFHEDIIRTIYFYGYWGALTEPPCSDEVTYRILIEPMYISNIQLLQLKNILFNQVDEKCRRSSVHHNGSVARPPQEQKNRPIWKCTESNFLSDDDRDKL